MPESMFRRAIAKLKSFVTPKATKITAPPIHAAPVPFANRSSRTVLHDSIPRSIRYPNRKRRAAGRGLVWAGIASPAEMKTVCVRRLGAQAFTKRARKLEQKRYRIERLAEA